MGRFVSWPTSVKMGRNKSPAVALRSKSDSSLTSRVRLYPHSTFSTRYHRLSHGVVKQCFLRISL